MSAGLASAILLGLAALATSVFGVITQIRDRGRSVRKQEGDIKRIEGNIELDETTRQRLAAEAAQINSDVAIAQQNWWRESFDAVREQLTVEQQRTRRLMKWAHQHQEWDQRAWTLARQADPDYPAPPELEHDD